MQNKPVLNTDPSACEADVIPLQHDPTCCNTTELCCTRFLLWLRCSNRPNRFHTGQEKKEIKNRVTANKKKEIRMWPACECGPKMRMHHLTPPSIVTCKVVLHTFSSRVCGLSPLLPYCFLFFSFPFRLYELLLQKNFRDRELNTGLGLVLQK